MPTWKHPYVPFFPSAVCWSLLASHHDQASRNDSCCEASNMEDCWTLSDPASFDLVGDWAEHKKETREDEEKKHNHAVKLGKQIKAQMPRYEEGPKALMTGDMTAFWVLNFIWCSYMRWQVSQQTVFPLFKFYLHNSLCTDYFTVQTATDKNMPLNYGCFLFSVFEARYLFALSNAKPISRP